MKIDDFCFMWHGRKVSELKSHQVHLLNPIERESGKRDRALLMLHGYSSSPAVFRQMIPALNIYDAIICPVLPGHCNSITAFAKVQGEEWLVAAEDTCAPLIQKYQKVDVLGLSMGGLLALHLGSRFPLHHLYLLAPALSLKVKTAPGLMLANLLATIGIKNLHNQSGNLHTRRAAELTYRKIPVATIIEILRLIRDFDFTPPPCPSDVFLGCYDEVVDSKAVAQFFAPIAGTRVHWLRNSAHLLPLDGDVNTLLTCIYKNWQQEKTTCYSEYSALEMGHSNPACPAPNHYMP